MSPAIYIGETFSGVKRASRALSFFQEMKEAAESSVGIRGNGVTA